MSWDWNVCHDWYWNSEGIVDVDPSIIYRRSGAPHPVAPPPPVTPAPAPEPLPPGTPFCSPRGALIIIPPICDEIGVDLPRDRCATDRCGALEELFESRVAPNFPALLFVDDCGG